MYEDIAERKDGIGFFPHARKFKRFIRKNHGSDLAVYEAYNLGGFAGWATHLKIVNRYPPGRRHDEFERGKRETAERFAR